MRGDTKSCFQDYASRLLNESGGSVSSRQDLIDFVGTTTDTSRRWIKGEQMPNGLALVKLRYFLEKKGYEIIEFLELEKYVYNLGLLIAYRIIEFNSVCSDIGYTSDSLLDLLHGKARISTIKMDLLQLILNKKENSLNTILAKHRPKADMEQDYGKLDETSAVVGEKKIKHEKIRRLVTALHELSQALIPDIEVMISENVSPDERREFREESKDTVFHASNSSYVVAELLSALCGEKAREDAIARLKGIRRM